MSLVKALGELTSKQARLSTGLLSELSCLTAQEMREFSVAWASAPAERRRKVLRQLAELAEDTIELDFTAVHRHALTDENDDVRAATNRSGVRASELRISSVRPSANHSRSLSGDM